MHTWPVIPSSSAFSCIFLPLLTLWLASLPLAVPRPQNDDGRADREKAMVIFGPRRGLGDGGDVRVESKAAAMPTHTAVIPSHGFFNTRSLMLGLCFIMAFKDKVAEYRDSQIHGLCHVCMLGVPNSLKFTVSKDNAPNKIPNLFS